MVGRPRTDVIYYSITIIIIIIPHVFAGDEQWLVAADHPDSLAEELDILLFLRESRLRSPYSLRTAAAAAIRRRIAQLTNESFLGRIDDLPLPKSLKADLKLDQIDLRKYVKMTDLD